MSVSKGLFVAYRVLAMVVGVLLAFCALIVFPARHFATEGSALQQWGEQWSVLWLAHGWIFIAYVIVSFLLWRQTRWSVPFAMLVMIAGLVPLVIFWVEHVVTRRIREEHPELATTPG